MKKLIALVLALILVLGTVTVASAAEEPSAPTGAANVLHFDTNTTGWQNYKRVFCHIWIYDGDSFYAWQSKRESCTDNDGDGIWTYDLDSRGISLSDGTLYAVVFSNENGMQTYSLLFDKSVLGDTACCDGTMYENPDYSSNTVQAAFWSNQDANEYGPEKCITSIGNVIGTSIPYTITAQWMLENFLKEDLENAREYSSKSDQRLIDDIAIGLNLSDAQVEDAIEYSRVKVAWSSDGSGGENEVPEYITGDSDLDGELSVLDAALIQLALVGKRTLEGVAVLAADADSDGEITVLDASLIQLKLVGKK